MYGRIGHRLPLGFYGSVGAPIKLGRRSKRPMSPRAQTAANVLGILAIIGIVGWLTIASGSLILIPGLIVVVILQINKGRKRDEARRTTQPSK